MREAPVTLVHAACDRVGEDVVVGFCLGVLDGDRDYFNGPVTLHDLGGGIIDHLYYWPRVWAVRALRYCWAEVATPYVVSALGDEAWRVREQAARVIGQRELGEAGDALAGLVSDETPRVRAAAARALAMVGEAEHADALRDAQDDPEPPVRDAAVVALHLLSRRLDRDL